MSDKERPVSAALSTRGGKILVTLLLLALAAFFVSGQLPRGAYPTDLSVIGAGRPVAVLAYDPNYAGGGRVMEIINGIRDEYADRIAFVVAPLGHPEGQAFARQYSAADGSLLLFAGDGARIATLHRPQDEAELRSALDAALAR